LTLQLPSNSSFALFYLEIKKKAIAVVSVGQLRRLNYEEDRTTKRSLTQSARGCCERRERMVSEMRTGIVG